MQLDASLLEQCIVSGANSFEPGELAYLALTSMIERPLLDRVAYQLHRFVSASGGTAAREWPIPGTTPTARADVAILQAARPVALLEGKAMYTFASLRNSGENQKYVARMQSDLDRLESAKIGKAKVFTLMFATNPRDPIPQNIWSMAKKPRAINSALSKLGDHVAIAEHTKSRMVELTDPSTLVASGLIDAGEAHEVGVDILWWLFGPFTAPDKLQLGAA